MEVKEINDLTVLYNALSIICDNMQKDAELSLASGGSVDFNKVHKYTDYKRRIFNELVNKLDEVMVFPNE